MSHEDLTEIFRNWPYEPGRINARTIMGTDGKEKLQVRLDLGILQMDVEGRPDGDRPEGYDSLLDLHAARLEKYVKEVGSPQGFVLDEEECKALREEAIQYYHRYVGLFSLGMYEHVVRDTDRNLSLFDFCHEHAAREEDQSLLEQFRPHVIAMRARAMAEMALAEKQPQQALKVLDQGIEDLRAVYSESGTGEFFDHSNEVQTLRGMRDALVPKLPMSQRVELEERLQSALDAENYELAAILRDELRMMTD